MSLFLGGGSLHMCDITHLTRLTRQNPTSCQDFEDARSYQDIPDEIQDPTKKSWMSRQSLEYFQDIQEFKIFLRYSRCRTL